MTIDMAANIQYKGADGRRGLTLIIVADASINKGVTPKRKVRIARVSQMCCCIHRSIPASVNISKICHSWNVIHFFPHGDCECRCHGVFLMTQMGQFSGKARVCSTSSKERNPVSELPQASTLWDTKQHMLSFTCAIDVGRTNGHGSNAIWRLPCFLVSMLEDECIINAVFPLGSVDASFVLQGQSGGICPSKHNIPWTWWQCPAVCPDQSSASASAQRMGSDDDDEI